MQLLANYCWFIFQYSARCGAVGKSLRTASIGSQTSVVGGSMDRPSCMYRIREVRFPAAALFLVTTALLAGPAVAQTIATPASIRAVEPGPRPVGKQSIAARGAN